MDVEERYKRIGSLIEPHVRGRYLEGIRKIEESDDPIRCLYELHSIFIALGESYHPGENKAKWAVDLIKAYRNAERIFKTLLPDESFNYHAQLSEIFSNHEDLLGEFGEERTLEAVDDSLKYLAEVRRILDESDYAYDDISKLEEELKDAGKINVVLVDWGIEPSELEKRLEKVEDLETKIGELEGELSELENL